MLDPDRCRPGIEDKCSWQQTFAVMTYCCSTVEISCHLDGELTRPSNEESTFWSFIYQGTCPVLPFCVTVLF